MQLPSLTKLQDGMTLSGVYHGILNHEEHLLPKVKALSKKLHSASMCACMTNVWPNVVSDATNLTHVEIMCNGACGDQYNYPLQWEASTPLVVSLRSAIHLRSLTLSNVVVCQNSLVGLCELCHLEEFRLKGVALIDASMLPEIGVSLHTTNLKILEIEFDPKIGKFIPLPRDIASLLANIGTPLDFFSLCQVTKERLLFRTTTVTQWLAYTYTTNSVTRVLRTFEAFAMEFLELLMNIDHAIVPKSYVLFGPGGSSHSLCQVINGELWRYVDENSEIYRAIVETIWHGGHNLKPGWRSLGDAHEVLRKGWGSFKINVMG